MDGTFWQFQVCLTVAFSLLFGTMIITGIGLNSCREFLWHRLLSDCIHQNWLSLRKELFKLEGKNV